MLSIFNMEINLFLQNIYKKFGCENIINIYNIMTIVPNFNFEVITKEILQIIPKDNDSIKGFTNNHNIFSSLINKFDIPALYI